MAVKVGINGFGRIGRCVLRSILSRKLPIDVLAINDLTDPATLAHLLKYDSVHGIFSADISSTEDCLVIDGKKIKILKERDPKALPWKDLWVEAVLESTGLFTKREQAQWHIDAGAKKVVISAPATDPDITVVLGVNFDSYDKGKHNIISNASCTTNCLAPIAKVIHESFGIEHGLMTTIHSYTNDQRILDLPHKDIRRARAAALSMIPTSTGAAKAVALVLPELKGKLDGLSIRVPTPNVSIVDLTAKLKKSVTADEVNSVLKAASEGSLAGILQYCTDELVSSDFNDNPHSSIYDVKLTKVIDGTLLKLFSWYDNEWGYSSRTAELLAKVV
ncbi:MAG: type I glyceraldehyde-3-phosphate dehydrogenase [Deferribacteraceae bacterium]|jgi:glyceraldehyde 3-phosphate dehydrogenase|nr:type I glyceraldehyde-3-phosphate dehydrogenase [Deferribacteraceae bacterium]